MSRNAPPSSAVPSRTQIARERSERELRRARRRAGFAAGEVKELNIVAMMDMMTILLVFLLKSYSASSLSINPTEDLRLPASTAQVQPQDNINVTISMREVAVNDRPVIRIENGVIAARDKAQGRADSFFVGKLHDALKKEVDKQKYVAQYNPGAPFGGRVNVVADKRVPYRTLVDVLYTAGQAELGEYKFMVMKSE